MSEFDATKVICPNCKHQFRAVPVDVQLEGTHQREEIERLRIALGQANADLMSYRARLERLVQTDLARLEAGAGATWYRREAELVAEIAELKAKLTEQNQVKP